MSTIPANLFANVVPSVLSAGGNALDLNGLVLTTNTRVPIGQILSFPSAPGVADFFGAGSVEAIIAGGATGRGTGYFGGYLGGFSLPGAILFAQYPQNPVAAWLRGGNISATPISTLAAYTGSLNVVMDGYTHAISSISFAGLTSQSAIAAALQAAFTDPTEASFTGQLGAAVTASVGGSFTTCTSVGTTLTVGGVGSGYLSVGDLVSGTDTTNSLPAGCHILAQLSGTPGGAGTYQLSAAATPGNLTSCTVTGTSTVLRATVVTGLVSVGDVVSTISAAAVVASQLTGTAGGAGTYQLSGITAQGIASGAQTVISKVLDVTVCASPTIAVGQTLTGSGITGSPLITSQVSGTPGGIGLYTISGTAQHIASEAMTGVATAPTVVYDSVSGAFVITSGITGAPSSAAFATGTLAALLLLTSATGATLSQGAAAAVPGTFMSAQAQITQNWATFMTAFDPDSGSGNTQKLAFAAWVNGQSDRYAYVCADDDITATESAPATGCLGYLLQQGDYSGTCLIYDPLLNVQAAGSNYAAFVCGFAASIDFERTNGRTTLAYRGQTGLLATVTDETDFVNLAGSPQNVGDFGNGYNVYAAIATANQVFVNMQRGSISGPFQWFDSYIDQIWLTNALQQALIELLVNSPSIPYNAAGNALISAALADPINTGLNFGAFRAGVTLSAAQIAEVNLAAGADIASVLQSRGWYLQIKAASPQVRQSRSSPPCSLWYTDGQSVQSLNLASILVQ